MIVGGVVLIVLAYLPIGIILVVVGAILWILGAMGRAVGPRTHYW